MFILWIISSGKNVWLITFNFYTSEVLDSMSDEIWLDAMNQKLLYASFI